MLPKTCRDMSMMIHSRGRYYHTFELQALQYGGIISRQSVGNKSLHAYSRGVKQAQYHADLSFNPRT